MIVLGKQKITGWIAVSFSIYLCIIFVYLFFLYEATVPSHYIGTAADPGVFLSEQEFAQAEQYGKIRNFLFLLEVPLEWIFYFLLFFYGIAARWESRARKISRWRVIRYAIVTFFFSLTSFVVFFPIRFARYYFSQQYGISVQSFPSWLKDRGIDFLLSWLVLFLIVAIFYWLIRKSERRWWFYAWLLAIPVALFMMFIQPVLIDPLYNEFSPLKNEVLEQKILHLAEESGVPADRVYEVSISGKTNAFNAYVTGVGSSARIVLWDTTLERLEEDEILFIMAHEIAHYVEKHVYIGMAAYLLLGLVLLFCLNTLLQIMQKKGWIPTYRSMATFPLILLIFSMLTFVARPLENAFSRHLEWRADRYAIELTENVDAGISAFQKMARAGLSETYPPVIIKWLRYTHPPIADRITYIQYDQTGDE